MPEELREQLLEAALRLLADGGPDAVQARRLAGEVGVSTMAVYTHFGGLPELVDALVREGFVRLEHRMAQVAHTEDPVADLFGLGLAYRERALAQPRLYGLMFGLCTPRRRLGSRASDAATRHDLTTHRTPTDLPEGQAAFTHLVTGLRRVMDTGRIHPADPVTAAGQIWSAIHGYVLLEISGYFGDDGDGVQHVLIPLSVNLLVGMGETPERARHSAQAVQP